jgi:hypothetical protein
MKVVCVNNGSMDGAMDSSVNLTPGKIYDVCGERVSPDDHAFRIVNDIGKIGNYYYGRFKMIDKVREEKLEKLGIS